MTAAPPLDPTTGMVVARGELHPRAGRRHHHNVTVRCCPWCGLMHAHRTAAVLPYYVRSPSCAGHRTYLIAVGEAPLPPAAVPAVEHDVEHDVELAVIER